MEKGTGWLPKSEVKIACSAIITYYQICAFPIDKKGHVARKYIFADSNSFVDFINFRIPINEYNLFKKKIPLRQYKEFATYDLDGIPLPSYGECNMAKKLEADNKYVSFKITETDFI